MSLRKGRIVRGERCIISRHLAPCFGTVKDFAVRKYCRPINHSMKNGETVCRRCAYLAILSIDESLRNLPEVRKRGHHDLRHIFDHCQNCLPTFVRSCLCYDGGQNAFRIRKEWATFTDYVLALLSLKSGNTSLELYCEVCVESFWIRQCDRRFLIGS